MSGKAYIYLEDKLAELLAANEHKFRSGEVVVSGGVVPFDAAWICSQIGWTTVAVADSLKRMAEDPTNHIVLRFKTADNPDVIHIDSVVLEFMRKHEFDVIMETGGFDAQFISDQLGLGRNYVACALRRIADAKNFIGLVNRDSDNPAPRRDYGVSRDTKYAAVAG
ncbi:MAG: hypothetical protein Q7R85_03090 [bacterium]|nr:hypothetical protein [bacterium]